MVGKLDLDYNTTFPLCNVIKAHTFTNMVFLKLMANIGVYYYEIYISKVE